MTKRLFFDISSDETRTQDFKLLKDKHVNFIRCLLMKYKDPVGTLTFKIKNGATVLASDTLTAASANSNGGFTANETQVGFFRFTVGNLFLKANITYTLELSHDTAFSNSAFWSWSKEHVNETNAVEDAPVDDTDKSFSYQLWGLGKCQLEL